MKSQKSKLKGQSENGRCPYFSSVTHHSSLGFTLVEIMVVVVIIGILATILITQIGGQSDIAKKKATVAIIEEVSSALEMFKLQNGRYPEKLTDLVNRPSYAKEWPTGGYLKKEPLDGWSNKFIYRVPSQYDAPYDIISYGADGKEGGEKENEDIWNHDKWKNK